METREDEEQSVKLAEILELLLAAGYFRARIKGLSPFDKVSAHAHPNMLLAIATRSPTSTLSDIFTAVAAVNISNLVPLVSIASSGGRRDDLVHHHV